MDLGDQDTFWGGLRNQVTRDRVRSLEGTPRAPAQSPHFNSGQALTFVHHLIIREPVWVLVLGVQGAGSTWFPHESEENIKLQRGQC
jgi:hypothetical protein